MDQAICRLNPNRRAVVESEYRDIGTRSDKAADLGITLEAYKQRLKWARQNLRADEAVKKLLKAY